MKNNFIASIFCLSTISAIDHQIGENILDIISLDVNLLIPS